LAKSAVFSFARDKENLNFAVATKPRLSACQSVHNIPIIQSRLSKNVDSSLLGQREEDILLLFQQLQSLVTLTAASLDTASQIEFETGVLTNALAQLSVSLSASISMDVPFDPDIGNDFNESLRNLSTYLKCDQIGFDFSLPFQSLPNTKTRSSLNDRSIEKTLDGSSEQTIYSHINNQEMKPEATARYLAQNPVTLLFEKNRFYVFLSILILISGATIYFYRRLKNFQAREPRQLLDSPVKVFLDEDMFDLKLVDLSRNGAKINHNRHIRKLGGVKIELCSQLYDGQIKWHNDNFAGIKFKIPLDEDVFEATIT